MGEGISGRFVVVNRGARRDSIARAATTVASGSGIPAVRRLSSPARSFGSLLIVCGCAFGFGCAPSPGQRPRTACEVWHDDQPIVVEPLCNNVPFLMMSVRSEADRDLDPARMLGRVITWTRGGLSYGPWQKMPAWFVSPDGSPGGY